MRRFETDLDMSRHLAIEALVGGSTITAAAQTAHVGRPSLNRWLKEPAFAAALSQARRAYLAAIHAVDSARGSRYWRFRMACISGDQQATLPARCRQEGPPFLSPRPFLSIAPAAARPAPT